MRLASLRLVAFLVDILIVGTYFVGAAFALSTTRVAQEASLVLDFVFLIFLFGYYAVAESRYFGGATLGKRLCGLAVLDSKASAELPLYSSVLRNVGKFGIPVLAAQYSSTSSVFLSTFVTLFLSLLIPASVVVGKGARALQDVIGGSLVVLRRAPSVPRLTSSIRYWLFVIFMSAGIALPVAAIGTWGLFGPSRTPREDAHLERALDQFVDFFFEKLSGSGLNDATSVVLGIRSFTPEAIPRDFDEWPMTVPEDVRTVISMKEPSGAFRIRLSPRGYESVAIKNHLINFVGKMLASSLPAEGPRYQKLMWLQFSTSYPLGPLTFVRGQKLIVVIDVLSSETGAFRLSIWEPRQSLFAELQLRWPALSLGNE